MRKALRSKYKAFTRESNTMGLWVIRSTLVALIVVELYVMPPIDLGIEPEIAYTRDCLKGRDH